MTTSTLARRLCSTNIVCALALLAPAACDAPEDESHCVCDALVSRQCLARELSGEDVAQMVLFLASDASAACTAQDFIVDGGMI